MDLQAALLDAVLDAPEEDAPRLVLADWLDEHGDEHDRVRAEFIRVQCELARGVADRRRWRELRLRERELQQRHQAVWLRGLWTPEDERLVTFHRGTVTLVLSLREFLAPRFQGEAEERFRRAGVVAVELWCADGAPERLERSAVLGRLASLQIVQEPFEEGMARRLAGNPHAGRLRRLALGYNRLAPGSLAVLAASPYL